MLQKKNFISVLSLILLNLVTFNSFPAAKAFSDEVTKKSASLTANVAWAQRQGQRYSMEDHHSADISVDFAFFGIYDGNGGDAFSKYVSQNLLNNIETDPSFKTNIETAINNGFLETESQLFDKFMNGEAGWQDRTGTTAITALFKNSKIYVANVGDSRAVLSINNVAVPLSKDHTPKSPYERIRIDKIAARAPTLGTIISPGGFFQLRHLLGFPMSRSLGNFRQKAQMNRSILPESDYIVSPYPEIIIHDVSTADQFLILACDGIWDVLSNQEAVDIVKKSLETNGNNYIKAAEDLRDAAYNKGSTDNLSAMIINVKAITQQIGGTIKQVPANYVPPKEGPPPAPDEQTKKSASLTTNVAWAERQGKRSKMEDAHAANISQNYAYFGIFDGHGGAGVSKFVSKNLMNSIVSNPNFSTDIKRALNLAFIKTDIEIKIKKDLEEPNLKWGQEAEFGAGSTAITALFRGDEIYVANVGDSRAVVSSNHVAIPLSRDHKPADPEEKARMEALGGGADIDIRANRYKGLAMSRALGDVDLKTPGKNAYTDPLTPIPEIKVHRITPADQFLILACDGIWDVLSNQEAVDIVRKSLASSGNNFTKAAEDLRDAAYDKGSTDNLSAMIINVPGIAKQIGESAGQPPITGPASQPTKQTGTASQPTSQTGPASEPTKQTGRPSEPTKQPTKQEPARRNLLPARITSIFGHQGYRYFVSELHQTLNKARNLFKTGSAKANVESEIKFAKDILDLIFNSAKDQIEYLTPLRSFLAANNLYSGKYIEANTNIQRHLADSFNTYRAIIDTEFE